MGFEEQIKRAYKKLKASVYYDKTQVILRNSIAEYESIGIENIELKFRKISKILNGNDKEWNDYEQKLLLSINALTLPKKIKSNEDSIIINDLITQIQIAENQYFIDMDVEGHLLGVLWILYIGKLIDSNVYKCSYGNRLSEKLISEDTGEANFTNTLFKPYFTQYESWRDYGLEKAQEHLKLSKDVIILTMDFRRFFYSVHFEEENFDEYLSIYMKQPDIGGEIVKINIIKRINKFVYKVLKKYSSLFKKEFEERVFLPIGFLPSNILSNEYLRKFDSAVIERWNPLYYGRYVDDIIIVDKVEKNSGLFDLVNTNTINKTEIIEYFLCKCNADKSSKCPRNAYLLKNDENKKIYYVNSTFLGNSKGRVEVQNNKVNVFYFRHNFSDALITKFKKAIALNKSEFRYMPEDDNILESGDYSEIFGLQYSDSINKLSGIKGVSIDKYELSKFLGKYLRVGGLINDKKELMFINDILRIFNGRVVIENYLVWEKIVEILAINNKFDVLIDFIGLIVKSISNLNYTYFECTMKMETSLVKILYAGLCRGLSLNWGENAKQCIESIYKLVIKNNTREISDAASKFSYKEVLKQRQNFLVTRMLDNNAIPALIDIIIESNNFKMFTDKIKLNLTVLEEFMKYIGEFEFKNINYYYYPYIISPQELQLSAIFYDIKNNEKLRNPEELLAIINYNYNRLNFKAQKSKSKNYIDEIDVKEIIETKDYDLFAIKVGKSINKQKEKIKVALANVKLDEKNFIDVLTNSPCRSRERYKNLAAVVKEAIKNNADILVLPESYLPIEWLPIVMSISAKTQMAIITGVEHIVSGTLVYNFTATILPFIYEDCKYAYLNMHSKVVYSPDEKFTIEGYRFDCAEGRNHELFVWNNLWFPVYCCFEVASIKRRALFQSIADLVVTIEWNHDINYYSSIIESLNRDLHCYCIQVNTSDYGDSRLIKPSKTENKDIVKIKGGVNSTALIDEINIKALRDFQIKEYGLQKMDKAFKPTPPFFSPDIVNAKRKGSLWNQIEHYMKE
ncbi:hypothetical protein [Inconstantimicrobium mannanitabidum]|uniref:Uncharacterized protein n=1 Tax=Inconstantimicrobium mannanitabidum TaxID=1604901 RepID=A0ACB5RAC6_9CLOT|nr:hypothetical protein [Clostridium sp. TW13]GKX65926.1 hypothetical protein rsdtw13_11840 [Clostridium sp. TW13]